MKLKHYQTIKLAAVIILAMAVSQSILFKNIFLPIIFMLATALILMLLRRRVKEVMADERDYQTGGQAALLAIQIYGWGATIGMLVLYGLRDYNLYYESIGLTLAYSCCFLFLLYGVIFRYYQKHKFADKKILYIIILFILFLGMAAFSLRLFSGEDDWQCQNGQWIPHGHPDFPAPTVPCK